MGRRKLVRILLESGYTTDRDGNGSQNAATNIELLNLQHERAIDIAQRKENKEIVEMLKNPSKIIANPNTTSSGIGVENNEDGENAPHFPLLPKGDIFLRQWREILHDHGSISLDSPKQEYDR